MTPYSTRIHDLMSRMLALNDVALDSAVERVAPVIAAGGVLHVFGSGHSALLAQELFHRAGGFAPINAFLDINLTIFGSSRPTWTERCEGYAASLFATYEVEPGETLVIISNSGINAVPIDLAMEASRRGLHTIGVGSVAEYASAESRHSSGKRLWDIVDLALDTCVPIGDALYQPKGTDVNVGAASTVVGSVLLNEFSCRLADTLVATGHPLPVFTSQNVPGGDERNIDLIARYRPRIPLMKP